MTTHTIRKVSHHGMGYSAVDPSEFRRVFASAVPRHGSTLRQQADDALRTIDAVAHEEGTRCAIVQQVVFMADIRQINECRQIIHDFYGNELPATSYIPQPPCEGQQLAIEAMGVGPGMGEVMIDRLSEQLVVVRHHRMAWAHCAPILSQGQRTGAYDDATNSFQQMRSLLASVNMRFGQVIRTWLYCGGIGDQEGTASSYQELNRARTDFYRNIRFLDGHLPQDDRGLPYPASTGIGAAGRRIIVAAIAMDTDREDICAVPLENPRQTSSYNYAASYSPTSPKFSRAMAVSCGAHATIFISGTASIIHSETQHPGDAVAQTHETLDNIAALISEENLNRHGLPGLGASLEESLGLVRVYIKQQEDYDKVRAVCEQRLGELPTVYAVADICRPELLVEVEGIAFACNTHQ